MPGFCPWRHAPSGSNRLPTSAFRRVLRRCRRSISNLRRSSISSGASDFNLQRLSDIASPVFAFLPTLRFASAINSPALPAINFRLSSAANSHAPPCAQPSAFPWTRFLRLCRRSTTDLRRLLIFRRCQRLDFQLLSVLLRPAPLCGYNLRFAPAAASSSLPSNSLPTYCVAGPVVCAAIFT
jgi:hypothetical protein